MKPANEGLAMVCFGEENIDSEFCTLYGDVYLQWVCRFCNTRGVYSIGIDADVVAQAANHIIDGSPNK